MTRKPNDSSALCGKFPVYPFQTPRDRFLPSSFKTRDSGAFNSRQFHSANLNLFFFGKTPMHLKLKFKGKGLGKAFQSSICPISKLLSSWGVDESGILKKGNKNNN